MKLTDYGLPDIKIWNPVTGELILDDIIPEYGAKSLAGIWFLDCVRDPHINDEDIGKAWDEYLRDEYPEDSSKMPDFFAIEAFLLEYEDPELQVIRHSSSGLAHSINGTVAWYVVGKDIIAEKADWGDVKYFL